MRAARFVAATLLTTLLAATMAACEGPGGEIGGRGPVGPIGAPGLTGPQGDRGTEGSAGARGSEGPRGEAGPAGADGAHGPQGESGPAGSVGPAGATPSDESLNTLIAAVMSGVSAGEPPLEGDILLGGLLYDNWMTVTGDMPAEDQPLWALQATNAREGAITWRCKECHGWDYKGAAGAYASGSHETGFTGIARSGMALSETELVDVLKGATDFRHDFSGVLDEGQLLALAAFVKAGLVNNSAYIDYATGAVRVEWDAARGEQQYGRKCKGCHGEDGRTLNSGTAEDPVYMGTLALEDPWEYLHKVRFGQPGLPGMFAGEDPERGWSLEDSIAILGYSQTLPVE